MRDTPGGFERRALAAIALLVWTSLHKRNQCRLRDIKRMRWRLAGMLRGAIVTYVALYALTTWLGTFA